LIRAEGAREERRSMHAKALDAEAIDDRENKRANARRGF
jgi:hypothetical protein